MPFPTAFKLQHAVGRPDRGAIAHAMVYAGGDRLQGRRLALLLRRPNQRFFTDVSGLTNVVGPFSTAMADPLAAQGGTVLGTNSAGAVVVAPQKPVQAFGGFIQLGLPLSRWFNANPQGHNAGWQLHFTIGKDQVVHSDQDRANGVGCAAADGSAKCNGGLPMSMGKSAIGTLYYKFNNWCSLRFEQSVYATRGFDHILLYTIAGQPSNEWQDHRTEFGRSSHSRPTFHPSGPKLGPPGFPVGSLRRPVHTEGTRPQKRRRTVSIRGDGPQVNLSS